jgi:hypothetical protein
MVSSLGSLCQSAGGGRDLAVNSEFSLFRADFRGSMWGFFPTFALPFDATTDAHHDSLSERSQAHVS